MLLFGIDPPASERAPGQERSIDASVTSVRTDGARSRWLLPAGALAAFALLIAIISGGSDSSNEIADDDMTTALADEDAAEPDEGDAEDERTDDDQANGDQTSGNQTSDDAGANIDSGAVGSGQATEQPVSSDATEITISDAVGEWRDVTPPPGTEVLLLESDSLIAASVPGPNGAGTRRQLWRSSDGRNWTEFGITPEGVSTVSATGPMLWGQDDGGALWASVDSGETWTTVPDDGQVETSELLTRSRGITAAAADPVDGSVVFQTTASWFFDVLAYDDTTELPDGAERCVGRASDGVLIFDNAECEGEPVRQITYDELDLTPRERGILRNPQRSAISTFWLIDGDRTLRSLRNLDDSLDGQPVLEVSVANRVVTVLQTSGIEHRLANGNVTLEMTAPGFDGPLGVVADIQIGRAIENELATVVLRQPSSRGSGWTRWTDTGIRADSVAVSESVMVAGSNPGAGAPPPISLEVGDGYFFSHNQSPDGDVFDLVIADSGTVLTASAGAIPWLRRIDETTWAIEIDGAVVGEFSDGDWSEAANRAGYDSQKNGLAHSASDISWIHTSTDGVTWIRSAGHSLTGRPMFVEAVLATPTSVAVAGTDASLDLDTITSFRPPRSERIEWLILDLSSG